MLSVSHFILLGNVRPGRESSIDVLVVVQEGDLSNSASIPERFAVLIDSVLEVAGPFAKIGMHQ